MKAPRESGPVYLPPTVPRRQTVTIAGRRRGLRALVRRGIHYGYADAGPRPLSAPADWADARPILLKAWAEAAVRTFRADIRRTLAMFEQLRGGAAFRPMIENRMAKRSGFEPGGCAVDAGDAREIEKVYYHARRGRSGRIAGRDLYAKLSWISTDASDTSLRIRFSFGSERMRDWLRDPKRSALADRFAQAAFPECAAIGKNARLMGLVRRLAGQPVRATERIIYNNAPGGGAVFHHDAEPGQIGVIYAQLAGETGWLAIRKRELAERLAGRLGRKARAVLRALDEPDRALERALNHSPSFAGELVRGNYYIHLFPGDVLLLPSHGPDDVAWHSVFALGDRASLSLSFAMMQKE